MKMKEDDYKKQFSAMLDEVNDVVIVCGIPFDPAEILEKCDPIAFRQAMLNEADILGIELE